MHGAARRKCRSGDSLIVRKLIFANESHVGMVRSDNQDFLGKFPDESLDVSAPKGLLFIVADGMGGHKAGKEASKMAVDAVSKSYFADGTPAEITDALSTAFRSANHAIYSHSMSNPRYSGMGTTCTALVIQDDYAYIGHIGDSRVYQISKKKIVQLTKDHSKVAEMQRRGIITREEAKTHPERSHLYRALGTKAEAEIDVISQIPIGKNEYFVMCTDGLFNNVEDHEIHEIVLSQPPERACKALVELANVRGGQDNITIQIIHVNGSESFFHRLIKSEVV
jgi:serine/threonine protein phosphatase PrpC